MRKLLKKLLVVSILFGAAFSALGVLPVYATTHLSDQPFTAPSITGPNIAPANTGFNPLSGQTFTAPSITGPNAQFPADTNINDPITAPDLLSGQTVPADTTQASKAVTANGTPKEGAEPQGCLVWSGIIPKFNMIACFASGLEIFKWMAALSLYLAGLILDTSLYFTIHLSEVMDSVPTVRIGWTIFRDLANIGFIFILLWTAISTILGLAGGKTKEIIRNVIIVGLLINFSLFITQAVVDASNIVAIHFYKLIVPDAESIGGSGIPAGANPFSKSSFSGAFMDGLKIQSVYSAKVTDAGPGGALNAVWAVSQEASLKGLAVDFSKVIFMALGGIALMLTAAYVFVVAAVLFILRIVVLMFLMLLSPLAFMAFVLPATEKYFEMWMEKLISQSIFAPIYLALAYVVVRTIQTPEFQKVMAISGQANAGGIFTSAGGIFINFLLLIGLMFGCILVAKKLEAFGEEMAMGAGSKFIKSALQGKHISYPLKAVAYGAKGAGAIVGRIPGLQQRGDKISGWGKATMHGAEGLQKKLDINELDKKFGKSAFGATGLGSLIREQTTGRLVAANYGGEGSLHESYEESEMLENQARDIDFGAKAIKSGKDLEVARSAQSEIDGNLEKAKVASEADKKKAKDTGAPPSIAIEEALVAAQAAKDKNTADQEKAVAGVSGASTKMTTHGFLDMQKSFFQNKNVMGIDVLGADKYNALMKSEGVITDEEKEGATKARLHYVSEATKTDRKERDAWLKYKEGNSAHDSWEERKKTAEKENEAYLNSAEAHQEYQKKKSAYLSAGYNPALLETQIGKEPADPGTPPEKFSEKEPPRPKEMGEPSWNANKSYSGMLRNIRSNEELEHYAKYNPEIYDQQKFTATIGQARIEALRDSTVVDATTKTKIRENKGYYIQEANDLIFGIDPVWIREQLEKGKMSKDQATAIRKERDDKLRELGTEGFKAWLGTAEARTGGKTGITITGNATEALSRHGVGMKMMPEQMGHKSDDEVNKMHGLIRNSVAVRMNINKGTANAFAGRDEGDDKRPMVKDWLRFLKHDMSGKGKFTESNIEVIKWIVNTEAGQKFANLAALDDESKDILEVSKVLYGKSDVASESTRYKTFNDAVERINEIRKASNPAAKKLSEAQIRVMYDAVKGNDSKKA